MSGVGGLAEPERVRVDMAERSCGMDDFALLMGGEGDSGGTAEAGSDMVRVAEGV